jgi:hypothetical protein
MEYMGKVKDGVVVLQPDAALKNGTVVIVTPARAKTRSTLGERLKKFSGIITDMPPDMSINHDHYLHGHPKK